MLPHHPLCVEHERMKRCLGMLGRGGRAAVRITTNYTLTLLGDSCPHNEHRAVTRQQSRCCYTDADIGET
jgi:hypothetical protein